MKIVLNGDPKVLPETLTIQQLLDDLKIPSGRVACEINLKIIKRAFYATTSIQEGDEVEIIQAIGGG
jgi:sulfur carrier protein